MQLLEETDRQLILAPCLHVVARHVLVNPAQVELFVSAFKHKLPAARIADLDKLIDSEARVVVQSRRQASLLFAGFDRSILQRHAAILHHIANGIG